MRSPAYDDFLYPSLDKNAYSNSMMLPCQNIRDTCLRYCYFWMQLSSTKRITNITSCTTEIARSCPKHVGYVDCIPWQRKKIEEHMKAIK